VNLVVGGIGIKAYIIIDMQGCSIVPVLIDIDEIAKFLHTISTVAPPSPYSAPAC